MVVISCYYIASALPKFLNGFSLYRNMILLLTSWMMFAGGASDICDHLMLSAMIVQCVQTVLVLMIILWLNSMTGDNVNTVRNICFGMDIIQSICYGIAEKDCGDGNIASIAIGVTLFLAFFAEFRGIGELANKGSGGGQSSGISMTNLNP